MFIIKLIKFSLSFSLSSPIFSSNDPFPPPPRSPPPPLSPPPVCGSDLALGGFFVRQGDYICTLDYQRLYGTRCFSCQEFIEGEVVSALGKTYHPRCFVCATCK